ncbi:type IV secretion system DNA-binding domain-containing protein [Novosphingobium panipatense]
MLIGTTGSGKTTELRSLVTQMRERQDTAVIFDLTGAYVEAFYDPARDTILNPMDARCPAWSIFNDCRTHSEFTAAAAALIPSDGGSSEPFWALAARTLFIEMCIRLMERGQTTDLALSENLMTADLKRVHRFLANTIADPLTAPEAARMAESIRAVFNTNAQALRFLPDDGEPFSIRDWICGEKKPGSILFVTSSYVDLPMNRALLTLWMDLAINRLMTLPRTRSLRTWFMFDELGALHKLPAIENGLQTARAFGGAMILGIHSFEKLVEVYGEQGARNLASLARSKLILATADLDTAEQCARYIGNREVRQMDEAYSYGYNNTRDASTLTPRKQVEPLVIADDITNLPSMHGFVKFPDGFPAARILLEWKDYPQVSQGFVQRPDIGPVRSKRGEKRSRRTGRGSGRTGRRRAGDRGSVRKHQSREGSGRAHPVCRGRGSGRCCEPGRPACRRSR